MSRQYGVSSLFSLILFIPFGPGIPLSSAATFEAKAVQTPIRPTAQGQSVNRVCRPRGRPTPRSGPKAVPEGRRRATPVKSCCRGKSRSGSSGASRKKKGEFKTVSRGRIPYGTELGDIRVASVSGRKSVWFRDTPEHLFDHGKINDMDRDEPKEEDEVCELPLKESESEPEREISRNEETPSDSARVSARSESSENSEAPGTDSSSKEQSASLKSEMDLSPIEVSAPLP